MVTRETRGCCTIWRFREITYSINVFRSLARSLPSMYRFFRILLTHKYRTTIKTTFPMTPLTIGRTTLLHWTRTFHIVTDRPVKPERRHIRYIRLKTLSPRKLTRISFVNPLSPVQRLRYVKIGFKQIVVCSNLHLVSYLAIIIVTNIYRKNGESQNFIGIQSIWFLVYIFQISFVKTTINNNKHILYSIETDRDKYEYSRYDSKFFIHTYVCMSID